jgi:hypothetical protein
MTDKRKPDFTGNDGIAAWEGTDKNGKPFLTIKVLGRYFNIFKREDGSE